MNYLSVENISKNYGTQLLFSNLSFGLQKGEKVALIAKNGTGKTSLLRIVNKKELPDTGVITYRKDIEVGYLEQAPEINPSISILENVISAKGEHFVVLKKYEEAVAQENTDLVEKLIPEMDRLKLWDAESRIKQILSKLKIYDVHRKAENLSGGEQKRIALASILLSKPEIMILDEPTNHLDIDMVEWLEDYLQGVSSAVLMVTHDRYFLENVCDQIIELSNQRLYHYSGNFSYYLEKKSERIENEKSQIEKAKNLYRKELDWIRRQPKARTTKSKARVDAFDGVKAQAKKRIDTNSIQIEFQPNRLGNKIIELHNISKSYGDKKLFDSFTYKFLKGEKVGVAGKNGVGKTTLINVITQKTEPDSGKVVHGETINIAHFDQVGLQLKKDLRVVEVLREKAEVIEQTGGKQIDAARLLEKFLFTRKEQQKFVSTLSGGEKRRLYLVSVLMSNPNFLILDEPTNDLDIITLSILEDYLLEFQGCVLLITHDRFLLDKVADHTFIMEGDGVIKDYVGKYSEYRQLKKSLGNPVPKKATKQKKNTSDANKLTYNDKRQFEMLDEEIPRLETDRDLLLEKMNGGSLTGDELNKLSIQLTELNEEIEAKTEIWLTLAEKY